MEVCANFLGKQKLTSRTIVGENWSWGRDLTASLFQILEIDFHLNGKKFEFYEHVSVDSTSLYFNYTISFMMPYF